MYTILTDVQITRRKRVHIVIDKDGDVQITASSLREAFDWLTEQAEPQVLVEAGASHIYRVTLEPLSAILKRGPDRPHPPST